MTSHPARVKFKFKVKLRFRLQVRLGTPAPTFAIVRAASAKVMEVAEHDNARDQQICLNPMIKKDNGGHRI